MVFGSFLIKGTHRKGIQLEFSELISFETVEFSVEFCAKRFTKTANGQVVSWVQVPAAGMNELFV